MNNKKGFNWIFLIIAFPLLLALSKDISFSPLTLKKPALDILYLIVVLVLLFLTFKKKNDISPNL